jgi:pilus assembly protein CpaB
MKKVYIIAVFVALLAGVATYFFASQIEQKTTIKDEPTKDVVVAIEAIPENTVITAEMLRVVQYPTRFINSDAAGSLQEVVGRLARQPIMKDEQVLKSKIVTIGTDQADTALSYQLRPGEYAYTIAADTVQGVAGFISKNDLVDVVYTENVEGENATTILLSDIRVLRLSNYAANYAANKAAVSRLHHTQRLHFY